MSQSWVAETDDIGIYDPALSPKAPSSAGGSAKGGRHRSVSVSGRRYSNTEGRRSARSSSVGVAKRRQEALKEKLVSGGEKEGGVEAELKSGRASDWAG